MDAPCGPTGWIIIVITVVLTANIRGGDVVASSGWSWSKGCCYQGMMMLAIIFILAKNNLCGVEKSKNCI